VLHADPARDHQGEDDGGDALRQDQSQQRHDDQGRDAVQDLGDSLHDHVDLAAEVAGDQAVDHADEDIDQHGGQGDQQRDAGALPDAGEQVAALGVGAEPVVDVAEALLLVDVDALLHAVEDAELLKPRNPRRQIRMLDDDGFVGMAGDHRSDDGHDDDDDDDNGAEDRASVLAEVRPDILGVGRSLVVLVNQLFSLLREGEVIGGEINVLGFHGHVSSPPSPHGCGDR